ALLLGAGFLATTSVADDCAQLLEAETTTDSVIIRIDGDPFTEYTFADDLKYPQFYPVNGPRSGKSVTTRRSDPYPDRACLFFACDRVNGGNYWQEGMERGRMFSKEIRLVQDDGNEIVFEQKSRWERPGAEVPFDDHRRISITAPSPDLRV